MLQKEMTDKELNFISLAPTNLAALIINGTTLHKFSSKIRSYKALESMKIDYIFVDEISMLKEIFYKFILMIKKIKSNVKIIMVGDYNQLPAINDRIGDNIDYGNSQALHEICDNNKLLLTTCRLANDEFFNLVKYDNIPNLLKTDFINLDD
jgi:ATP-dependent exoDNAse (exonuclease V) alpha subunit